MSKLINLIAIGYAKRALTTGTRERIRMKQYAAVLASHHLIVFTRQAEGFPAVQQEGNLFLYATNARTRLGMLWRAYQIGKEILAHSSETNWVVSSQDPFETTVVGRAVTGGNRATHHIQIHGDVLNPQSYAYSLWHRLRVWYARRVVRQAHCIRVVSDRIARSLVALGVSESVITVLPIQSDLSAFLEVGERRVAKPDNKPAFLYVGRLAAEKNLTLLITAFAQLAKEYPNPTLTIIGSGPEQSTLSKLIERLGISGRVTMRDWTDDVAKAMATHDVFCLASDHEGWGMVLLEAAASGMAVVTTDIGSAGEVVKDGETGKVVAVGSVEQYYTAMETYSTQPELVGTHGQRGHELAKTFVLPEETYRQKIVDSFASCLD